MEKSIDNFPGEDLRTIDRLWVKYSNSCFGFSVQAKIYRDIGGTRDHNERVWNTFGDKVGWRVKNDWINYSDVTFGLKAPKGHLPVIGSSKQLENFAKFNLNQLKKGGSKWGRGSLLLRRDL